MARSGSCPSLRKTRAIEIHVKCHSFQLSTQTCNASCQQGRFYLQKGGQLGLQSLPSPRHTCTCPWAGYISQYAEPAPRSAGSHPWSSSVPALGGSESRAGARGCRQLCAAGMHQGQPFCSPFPLAPSFTVLLSYCHPLGTSLREGGGLA